MIDQPVLVVDVRSASLDADRHALTTGIAASSTPDESLEVDEMIAVIAVLHDGAERPLLLPIEPTRDRAWLDTVARLLRFAVLRGERMPTVATKYGDERERRLTFERALPQWAYEGVQERHLRRAPDPLRRALGRPASNASRPDP